MAVIAVFNPKGGVGKTTLSVNLANLAAQSGYRTLLWEVDESGDSHWLMAVPSTTPPRHQPKWIPGALDPERLVQPTSIPNMSIIAADTDQLRTNNWFGDLARRRQISQLFADIEQKQDLVVLDCPPGLGEANRAILQQAHLVIVPCIPDALAMRGFIRVRDFMVQHKGAHPPLLPVFSKYDGRRKLHRAASEEYPDWPVIPMRSAVERMSRLKRPLTLFAQGSDAGTAFARIWHGVQRKLHLMHVLRVKADANTNANDKRSETANQGRQARESHESRITGTGRWAAAKLDAQLPTSSSLPSGC